MSLREQALGALRAHFGFEAFREGQDEVVEAILAGEDAIVVMPTGGGKSLCYQLPALMRDGATVVVSPLIALMKDQVDALSQREIPATFINSSISVDEQSARLRALRRGGYKLVYVAPERFKSERFLSALGEAGVGLFAVDEAHCISHWGHDFRPDYMRLGEAVQRLGRPQVVALTATATAEVRNDIAAQLGLTSARQFVAGFDRPNLKVRVAHTKTEREKVRRATDIVRLSGGTGIVYVATRKAVDTVAESLRRNGLKAVGYHAGMPDRDRAATQDEFMRGDVQAIVATNAFGMGIDKADIRFVVHYQLPGSIEAYYQEIGRAGRDGLPAECTLLFNYADTRFQQFFIEGSYPAPEFISDVYRAVARLGPGRHDISPRELAFKAGLKNDMAVGAALSILEKAGHIARGAASDDFASVEFTDEGLDAARSGGDRNGVQASRVLAALAGRLPRTGRATQVSVPEIASECGLGAQQVRRALGQLEERGVLRYRRAFQDRGIELLDSTPASALRVDRSELARRAALEQRKLRRMVDYAYHDGCLRAYILRYFGDRKRIERCETCGNCAPSGARPEPAGGEAGTLRIAAARAAAPAVGSFIIDNAPTGEELREHLRKKAKSRARQAALEVHTDPESRAERERPRAALDEERTLLVRKVLSCVARMRGRFGKGMVAAVLRGSREKKLLELELDKLSTYGILKGYTQEELTAWCDALVDAGYFAVIPGAYPTVSLTEKGREVMAGRAPAIVQARTRGL